MAEQTKIEWCDATFNPWIGCTRVSPACDDCYAARSTPVRARGIEWGPGKQRQRTTEDYWRHPIRWNAEPFFECSGCGWRGSENDYQKLLSKPGVRACCPDHKLLPARRRVFCASLADVFDNEVDPQWRADLFFLIYITPNLDWLLLTKRIGNAKEMIRDAIYQSHLRMAAARQWPWENVWLGATVVTQPEVDRDVVKLLQVPARVRFLSIEPMLGAIQIRNEWLSGHYKGAAFKDSLGTEHHHIESGPCLSWIIAGGESGPKARPVHPDWIRSLRDQCAAAGVRFLFKQWGEHSLEYDRDRDDPDWRKCAEQDRKPGRWINLAGGHGFHGERVHYARKVGKKAAGNMLDGRQHLEWPV